MSRYKARNAKRGHINQGKVTDINAKATHVDKCKSYSNLNNTRLHVTETDDARAWRNNVDDPLPGLAFKPLAQEARDATLTM